MNKQPWIDAAHIFDIWRVPSRVVLFGYCWWVSHVTDTVLTWYENLPGNERTLEASGLAGAIITGVTGMAIWVYKIYTDNSNDWGNTSSSTATVTTQTVSK